MQMSRTELLKAISEQRAALAHLRRQLPKPGPSQTREQAAGAYWLERAIYACEQASEALHSPTPTPGGH